MLIDKTKIRIILSKSKNKPYTVDSHTVTYSVCSGEGKTSVSYLFICFFIRILNN